MTFTEISNFNITGIEGLLLYVAEVVPVFIPLTLFSIFLIVLFGTFFSGKRVTGSSDFISSFAVAGWFTTLIAFILSLNNGLVNLLTLTICIVVSVIGAILLFTSGDKIA